MACSTLELLVILSSRRAFDAQTRLSDARDTGYCDKVFCRRRIDQALKSIHRPRIIRPRNR
jgi:hypothetical protein